MKKIIALLGLVVLLSGCDKDTEDRSGKYQLKGELSHCKVFRLQPEGSGKVLYVVKCPNSTTGTVTAEKSPTHTFYTEENL